LFISKSFKELFSLTAFFRKADAKVKLIFEPTKLFQEKNEEFLKLQPKRLIYKYVL